MNLAARRFRGVRTLSLKFLTFFVLAGIACAASALDSTRYYPLKTGYTWTYKSTSTGKTYTSTVGNPVRLSTGVLAFAVAQIPSDPSAAGYQITSFETSDQNGARLHQFSTVSADSTITATTSPPMHSFPPNATVGSTYTYSATVSTSTNNKGTVTNSTVSHTSKIEILGFETVANFAGTQSWRALKVVVTTTTTVSGQTPSTYISTHWFVDGIGLVQYAQPNASGVVETYKLSSTNVVPFEVAVTSTITATSATVATRITFKPAEVGKPGSVYVTAMAPLGSLAPAQSALLARSVSRATTTPAFVLFQLTSSGWQQVVNGQLIPYASGTLGEALAAQSILNNTDPANLKGAQFCLGYGSSATEMAAAARIQSVADIPDASAAATSVSCLVGLPLALSQGWNLLGNSAGAALDVATAFGDATKVTSVWKWVADTGKWAFYSPSLVGPALTDYAASKGYDVLTAAYAGEGVWVNAKTAYNSALPPGAPVAAASFQSIGTGWSLIAVGEGPSPSVFNKALSLTPPATGEVPINLTTLWAWDAAQGNWYFYAPSLEKSGGLPAYITSRGYLDFGSKVLEPTTGFWVNKP